MKWQWMNKLHSVLPTQTSNLVTMKRKQLDCHCHAHWTLCEGDFINVNTIVDGVKQCLIFKMSIIISYL